MKLDNWLDTAMAVDLFGGFSAAEIAAVEAGEEQARDDANRARAMRRQGRVTARRLRAEKHLAEILPPSLDDGESLHVVSHGDVDSLSYLRYVLSVAGPLEHALLSTWCMAQPDIDELHAWLRGGEIATLDWYVGEIFPSQYPGEYVSVQGIVAAHGGRLCVARNHSKVMALRARGGGCYVVESSANINTNPRIEQTAITRCEDLYWFYRDFFDGLRSIARD